MRKAWEKKEIRYLIKHRNDSIGEIAEALGRTRKSVERKIANTDFDKPLEKSRFWTNAETNFLKRNYKKLYIKEIASKLGRSIYSVKKKMQKLNLSIQKKWSEEEINFLIDKVDVMSPEKLAIKLHRSRQSVLEKSYELSLFNIYDEKVYLNRIASILCGCKNASWYYRKLKKMGVPYEIVKSGTRQFYLVDMEKFWKWAEKHKDELNFSKFDRLSLGAEPSWVRPKRINDMVKAKWGDVKVG